MNQDRITKMLEHEPYSCIMKNYELADILFENEGLMTVPKKSANTIVDLLNIAYKNGVKSAIKQYSMNDYNPMCTNSGLTYLTSNNPIDPQGSQGSQHIEPVKQINNFNSEKSLNDESDKQINNFKPKKKLFKII